ncbi:hypothetical protein QF035_000110 [Streptomyces umbrinus]|uniref:DUF732 domain-containing protein n=1 Tax=Streptomyces umbrinus TaxID=67370 RepID=A0ABU0SG35_9ACTN|nr:DUF732 domain-containing protein [Streptomyces umbrinus]MDQ1022528.1 hypothetical protein [Streptomyces umbrinus]
MVRRSLAVAATALILLATGGLTGCGSDRSNAAPPPSQSPTHGAEEEKDARFLTIVEQQGVLSAKPDMNLVKLGHFVCQDDLGILKVDPGLAAAELVSEDHSLSQAEAEIVQQAAIKVYCPDMAP